MGHLHAQIIGILNGTLSGGEHQAAALLARIRPASTVERARKDLARDLVADVRMLDDRLTDNKKRMQEAVAESGSTLTDIVGVGPVVAARLLGRTGHASRFPTSAAFAVYCGVAPIEIASGDKARHRLSQQGDRRVALACPSGRDAGVGGIDGALML